MSSSSASSYSQNPSWRHHAFQILNAGTVAGRDAIDIYSITSTYKTFMKWASLVRVFLAAMIMLSLFSMMMETVPSVSTELSKLFLWVETITLAIFTVEYVIRVWTSVEHLSPKYHHPVWGRLRYMISPMALVDLMAILPFYLAHILGIGGLRYAIVLRLLRIVKMMRYSPAMSMLIDTLYNERQALTAASMIMFLVLVFSATGIWFFEAKTQPEFFASIPQSLWWAMISLTTVGYGDVVPLTAGGKVFGGLVSLMGITIYALPAAILTGGFVRELEKKDFLESFQLISSLPAFNELDPHRISKIITLLRSWDVDPKINITQEDTASDALYFITEGEIRQTWIDNEGKEQSLILREGDYFGNLVELGRNATGMTKGFTTCQTLTASELMVLSFTDLMRLLHQWPDFEAKIARAYKV